MTPKQIIASRLDPITGDDRAARVMQSLDEAGYAIVPKEPTPAMLDAACATNGCKVVNGALGLAHTHGFVMPNDCVERSPLNQMWDAMLAVVVNHNEANDR